MFRNFVASEIGLVHLLFSIFAMISGSFVLFTAKGTKLHRNIGYAYVVLMLGVNITALMIYRLTGSFGLFHAFAIWGIVAITIGFASAFFRKPAKNWLVFHYYFMYWSVIALYAAFAAEMAVRVPEKPFWTMVGIASGAVSVISTVAYFIVKKRWDKLATAYR